MLDIRIIPAIIPRSLAHLRESIERLRGVASEIQIDIVDDAITPDSLPTTVPYELDLMVADLPAALPSWLAQKPKSVVLHIESFVNDTDVARAIELVRKSGSKAILASLNDTPLARLRALVPQCDGVQCMGIAEIGRQGNPFDERVLLRVRRIREAYPALSISVDGSVNKDTILPLKAAGADRFVVGSGIFNTDDPVRAYCELCALMLS